MVRSAGTVPRASPVIERHGGAELFDLEHVGYVFALLVASPPRGLQSSVVATRSSKRWSAWLTQPSLRIAPMTLINSSDRGVGRPKAMEPFRCLGKSNVKGRLRRRLLTINGRTVAGYDRIVCPDNAGLDEKLAASH